MKVVYDGNDYDVFVRDDGSLDTIIIINGDEHRLTEIERDKNGNIAATSLRNAAIDIINSDERYW